MNSAAEQKIRNSIVEQLTTLVDSHLDAILDAYGRALVHHSEDGSDKPLKFPVGFKATIMNNRDWSVKAKIRYGVAVSEESEQVIREEDMVDLMGKN